MAIATFTPVNFYLDLNLDDLIDWAEILIKQNKK